MKAPFRPPRFGRDRTLLGPVPCQRCRKPVYLARHGFTVTWREADGWTHVHAKEQAA